MEQNTPLEKTEKKPRKQNRFRIHWHMASTIIFCGVVLMLVSYLFTKQSVFTNLFSYIWDVIRPIVIGMVIAFLLNRLANTFEKLFQPISTKHPKLSFLSVLVTYLIALLIVVGVFWIIIPQLVLSITDFAGNIRGYYGHFLRLLNRQVGDTQLRDILSDYGLDFNLISSKLADFSNYVPTILSSVGGWAGTFMTSLIGGVIDAVIGFLFSVYIVAGRHKLKNQCSRLFERMLPEKHYTTVSRGANMVLDTFSDFISGKALASLIVGIILYICMKIFGLEYAMMISVIVGITNMIPVMGPIFGAIPGIIILLIENPWHAIIFLILILCIQQLDGNIITPKIVGDSLGIPPLWILFAITVGGNLMGVVGMLISVPIMSIIYNSVRDFVNKGKPQKEKPVPKKLNIKTFGIKIYQYGKQLALFLWKYLKIAKEKLLEKFHKKEK